jgi:hypothetical protein
MKRSLIVVLLIFFALMVCGGVLLWWALSHGFPAGSGGIGSVSFGISEGVVVTGASVIFVLFMLSVRTIVIRYRNLRSARDS